MDAGTESNDFNHQFIVIDRGDVAVNDALVVYDRVNPKHAHTVASQRNTDSTRVLLTQRIVNVDNHSNRLVNVRATNSRQTIVGRLLDPRPGELGVFAVSRHSQLTGLR